MMGLDWLHRKLELKQELLLSISMNELGTIEMINPRIVETSGEQTGPEGCLSFPDLFGEVTRPNYVKIEAFDRKGKNTHLKQRNSLQEQFNMKSTI